MKKINLTSYETKTSDELKELIEFKVKSLYLQMGRCDTENLDIELMLTDEQLELFDEIDLDDNYYWEKLKDYIGIYLSYSEN